MRKPEPPNHARKITGRIDRDVSIPLSQTNQMRAGERRVPKVMRNSTYVPDTKRDRVEVPADDGDMYRPDPVCDDLVC